MNDQNTGYPLPFCQYHIPDYPEDSNVSAIYKIYDSAPRYCGIFCTYCSHGRDRVRCAALFTSEIASAARLASMSAKEIEAEALEYVKRVQKEDEDNGCGWDTLMMDLLVNGVVRQINAAIAGMGDE